MVEEIAVGAEAVVYRWDSYVFKYRVSKKYRHPVIDKEKTVNRTRREKKLLAACKKNGLCVPSVFETGPLLARLESAVADMEECLVEGDSNVFRNMFQEPEQVLVTEYCPYQRLSEVSLDETHLFNIGKGLRKMHDCNIVHHDLSFANILVDASKNIYFIDFGLGFVSEKEEDKAVDIFVFEKLANLEMETTEARWESFLKGYGSCRTISRLESVRKRGRKKHLC